MLLLLLTHLHPASLQARAPNVPQLPLKVDTVELNLWLALLGLLTIADWSGDAESYTTEAQLHR